MSVTALNRIRKQLVDVVAFGPGDGFALRQRVEELCVGPLAQRLEAMLDSLPVAADEVVEIDRIEVDCAVSGELGESVVTRIIEAIRTDLARRIGSAGAATESRVRRALESILNQLIYYLEHGHLPWMASAGAVWQVEAEAALRSVDAGCSMRLRTLLREAKVRARLVEQFGAECAWFLARKLCATEGERTFVEDVRIAAERLWSVTSKPAERDVLEVMLSLLMTPASMDVMAFKLAEILVTTLPRGTTIDSILAGIRSPRLREAIESVRARRPVGPTIESHPARPGARSESPARAFSEAVQNDQPGVLEAIGPSRRLPDPIYVRNAGAVIVAPYFPAFFGKLELARDGKILDPSLALVLIHYLVFGTADCLEHEAVLSKILCGIPLEDFVRTRVPLPEAFQREADELLESVIRNWSILKSTSIEGLRTSFLQREGALERSEDGWMMRMERKAFDVLLDHLPWTISMIRLPWMTETLRTSWT
jgi:hypothetical protein